MSSISSRDFSIQSNYPDNSTSSTNSSSRSDLQGQVNALRQAASGAPGGPAVVDAANSPRNPLAGNAVQGGSGPSTPSTTPQTDKVNAVYSQVQAAHQQIADALNPQKELAGNKLLDALATAGKLLQESSNIIGPAGLAVYPRPGGSKRDAREAALAFQKVASTHSEAVKIFVAAVEKARGQPLEEFANDLDPSIRMTLLALHSDLTTEISRLSYLAGIHKAGDEMFQNQAATHLENCGKKDRGCSIM